MSTALEDLIRQAQQRRAEHAVHGERIRATLPARAARLARRRRYGALASATAAVAVAAAVTVPILALRGGTDAPAGQPAGPTAKVEPADGAPGAIGTFPLRYKPTWLPDGLAERSRSAGVDPETAKPINGPERTWTQAPAGPDGKTGAGVSLSSRPAQGRHDPQGSGGTAVEVNGQPGFYHGGDPAKSYLQWRANADTVLIVSVRQLPLTLSDLTRIARSVQPDTGKMRMPLRLGWLPAAVHVHTAQVSGNTPQVWQAEVSAERRTPEPDKGTRDSKLAATGLTVTLGPTTLAPAGGRAVTVAGHPGRLVNHAGPPSGVTVRYLVMDVGAGRLLTVGASWSAADPLSDEDLIRVALNAAVDTTEQSWIGTR